MNWSSIFNRKHAGFSLLLHVLLDFCRVFFFALVIENRFCLYSTTIGEYGPW